MFLQKALYYLFYCLTWPRHIAHDHTNRILSLIHIINGYFRFNFPSYNLETHLWCLILVHVLVQELEFNCVFDVEIAENYCYSVTCRERLRDGDHRLSLRNDYFLTFLLFNHIRIGSCTFKFKRFNLRQWDRFDLGISNYFTWLSVLSLVYWLFFDFLSSYALFNLFGVLIHLELIWIEHFVFLLNLVFVLF